MVVSLNGVGTRLAKKAIFVIKEGKILFSARSGTYPFLTYNSTKISNITSNMT